MSTTVAAPPDKGTNLPAAQPTKDVELMEIALDRIKPSPYNRKTFNPQALEELAASIVQTNGVVEPIVVRLKKATVADYPAFKLDEHYYEIVAGERRWLATKIARDKLKSARTTVTSIVKELTDDQAMELLLIENGQREDVHPLELARIYRTLLGKTDSTTQKKYTPELIAERVKKSPSAIYQTLQLDQLTKEIQEAFLAGKINASHAVEICRLQPKQQELVFLGCFGGIVEDYDEIHGDYQNVKEVAKDKNAEASVGVRRLRQWIQDHILRDLKKAPFDVKDKFLLKGVGNCIECPKRTGANPNLFGDLDEGKKGDLGLCSDPGCYDDKKDALVQIKIAEAQRPAPPKGDGKGIDPEAAPLPKGVMKGGYSQTGAKAAANAALPPAKEPKAADVKFTPLEVQKISSEHLRYGEKAKPDVLYEGRYKLAKPGCKKEKKAIYVDGPKVGQFTHICAVRDCGNHGYGYSSGRSHEPVSYERRMEIWRQKVQSVFRDELLKTILTKLPPAIGNPEAVLVANHILKTLPHRHAEKVARIYGLKEDASVDAYCEKLKGAELQRFIVVCSLVEDLGVDGLAWGQLKGSLKAAAAQYKVDADFLQENAKTALQKKRPKSPAEEAAIEKQKKQLASVIKSDVKAMKKARGKVQTSGKAAKPAKKAKTKKSKK